MLIQALGQAMALGMHIPDGFLSAPVALLWWVLTVAALAVAVQHARGFDERRVPLMGVMAAFIFAAQMLNFPVLGGTSGHLLGGALAALLLGPWAGMLVMTCVIALQALLFQDGGLLALGANIFNMGVATALVGHGVGMPLIRAAGGKPWGLIVAGFVAAWLSVMVAAFLTSLQLALSGLAPAVVFPAMLFVHAFIGIGEGLITVAALAFVATTRPDLVPTLAGSVDAGALGRAMSRGAMLTVTLIGLAIAVGLTLIAPLASAHPDGLERVAEDHGFIERAQDPLYNLLPDYTVPGLDGPLSTILSGVIGLLIVFALAYGIMLLIRGRREPDPETPG
ncbi:MAG: energy-coupling factor ABC transporter permease [Chloroflexaceae bacterium]